MYFIKDEEFIRGDCPMTKEDVRMLTVCKMNVQEEHNVLDIGSGTGSISIQCSKMCPKGKVIAIEKDEEALKVIEQNKGKFNCNNLHIIKGDALEVEPQINEMFHSIFIGGSSGDIEDIIKTYGLKLHKSGVMILNFITLSNVYKAMECLKSLEYKVECTQIAVNKVKGKSYMLMANNPIFIVEARR